MPLAIQVAEYIHHAYFHGTFDSAVLSQHGRGCPRSIRKVAMHGTHMHCPIICFVRCCLQQLVDQRILQEGQTFGHPPCAPLPIGRTGARVAGRVPRNTDWLAIFGGQLLAAVSPSLFNSISCRSCSIGRCRDLIPGLLFGGVYKAFGG